MDDMRVPTWQESRDIVDSLEKLRDVIRLPQEQSVFLVDVSCIASQYHIWKRELPFVTPYYAMKCNPHIGVVQTLFTLGAHFDCASAGEIEQALEIGAKPEQIIFANPIKGLPHLKYAKEKQVEKMTFDSKEELQKIQEIYPGAKKVLRIAVDDSQSVCKFNSKFGAFDYQIAEIFQHIQETRDDIYGVSFHVGSGCQDPQIHKNAILSALEIMQKGRKLGMTMKLLDIGGGYPASDRYIKFTDITRHIREVYDTLGEKYPELQDIEWIGEPGRYMVGTSHTLITEVIGKKKKADGSERVYITEGLYSCLSGVYFDYMSPVYEVYGKKEEAEQKHIRVFGPTCDSLDTIGELSLPEVEIGEKILFYHIGDYSLASGSNFNGFTSPKIYFYASKEEDEMFVSQLSGVTKL